MFSWISAGLVWLLLQILGRIPDPVLAWLARGLARLIVFFLPQLRRRILHDAKPVLLSPSAALGRHFVRQTLAHFLLLVFRSARRQRLPRRDIAKLVVSGSSHQTLESLLARGHGVIAVTAHLGDWEAMGMGLAAQGYPIHTLVRPLDNPVLERWLDRTRRQNGLRTITKFAAVRPVMEALRAGELVCFLCDQNAALAEVWVDFLGRPAAAVRGPALFARKFPEAAIMIGNNVVRGQQVELLFRKMPREDLDPADPNFDQAFMQRVHDAFAEDIGKAPEQYLWLHPRWKRSQEAPK